MGFTNNPPTTELIIPSDGTLTSGSGTVYIGGPNLPAELKAINVSDAIIFYSSAYDHLNVDYYFIAHFDSFDGWARGHYAGGNLHINESIIADGLGVASPNAKWFLNATTIELHGWDPAITIRPCDDGSGPGMVFFDNFANPGEVAMIDNLGVAPVVKALSATIDTPLNYSVTSTVGGVASVVTTYDWVVTIDRIVSFTCVLNFPSAPASLNWSPPNAAGFTFPQLVTTILTCMADNGAPATRIGVPGYLGTAGISLAGGTTNPSALKRFWMSATYAAVKP